MLGNLLFLENKWEAAISVYQEALQHDARLARLRTNLGVALSLLASEKAAASEWKQAILTEASLTLPHFHLGKFYLAERNFLEARSCFQRVTELDPQFYEAWVLLGKTEEQLSNGAAAQKAYTEALVDTTVAQEARNRLGHIAFLEGEKLFREGNWQTAFRIWAAAEESWPGAFASDYDTLLGMKSLVMSFHRSGVLEKLLDTHRAAMVKRTAPAELYYEVFSQFFFSLSLIPQVFVLRDALSNEITKWQSSLDQMGEHPYARFRLGVLCCYKGELRDALQHLTKSKDALPPAKQESLQLEKILALARELYRLQMREFGVEAETASPEEWHEGGFLDPFQIRVWSASGLHPTEARSWKEAGFSPDQAAEWRKHQILPESALPFREFRPTEARPWIRAGISAATAQAWLQVFPNDIETSIQCLSVGFASPEEAKEWLQIIRFPSEAIRWKELGFSADQTKTWLMDGIKDPYVARREQDELENYLRELKDKNAAKD